MVAANNLHHGSYHSSGMLPSSARHWLKVFLRRKPASASTTAECMVSLCNMYLRDFLMAIPQHRLSPHALVVVFLAHSPT